MTNEAQYTLKKVSSELQMCFYVNRQIYKNAVKTTNLQYYKHNDVEYIVKRYEIRDQCFTSDMSN